MHKLTHNKEVIYPACLCAYFIVSSAEFHIGSLVQPVHEVADELSHAARALLRMLEAVPSFPIRFQ